MLSIIICKYFFTVFSIFSKYLCIFIKTHSRIQRFTAETGKIGAKCILYVENAPTVHTFEYSVLGSYSQYPYVLGFDSNLVPNPFI